MINKGVFMKITREIKKALEKAVDDCGSVFQLSKKLGVSHSTVLFWLNGKTSNMSGDVWYEKVKPILAMENRGAYASGDEASGISNLQKVPVISFANAMGYDPTLEPIDSYAKDCSDELATFMSTKKDGYFALRVEGDSMSPVLPNGSIIYVAGGEFAENGDLVVAKIRDSGQVVVKNYSRNGSDIVLESINPRGKTFKWNTKEQPDYLVWMWPVIEYTVKARRQRWEKNVNKFS